MLFPRGSTTAVTAAATMEESKMLPRLIQLMKELLESRFFARSKCGGSRVPLWCLTLPQSLWLSVVADGIFAFFLLALSFSPALTTSLVSFLQVGQYLRGNGEANGEGWGEHRSEGVYPSQ